MRNKKMMVVGLFLLWVGALVGQSEVEWNMEASLPQDSTVIIDSLPNGLRYYIRANDEPKDRAALRLVIKAGSLQEDADQLGVAHFVEHMAFNGTRHFAKNELVDYLESVGMQFGPDLNAYTSFEETVYLLQTRTDSAGLLEKGLLILEDWASAINFSPEEIDKERGVVISEWRSSLSPDQRLQREYFPVQYAGSRYARRLPIGDPKLIDTVAAGVIRRFYRDWYRPDLMAIVAVGDFDAAAVESEIRRRFDDLEVSEPAPERKTYHVPLHDSLRFVRATDEEAPFTRIRLTYKHPEQPLKDMEDLRTQLTHSLSNSMLNARLYEIQQQADPPFTFAYSGYGSDLGSNDAYSVSAFTAEGRAQEGLEAVLRETHRARLHGFTESELMRKKAELISGAESAFLERDQVESRNYAARYVAHYLDEKPLLTPDQRLRLYRKLLSTIHLKDINPLPQQWLTTENRTLVVTGPEKAESPLPGRDQLLALLDSMRRARPAPYVDEVSEGPLLEARLEPADIIREHPRDSFGLTEWTLANGLRVVLKPTDFQNDQVLMSSFSPGGHSLYSLEDYPSASRAAALVDLGGLGRFPATALEKKLAGKRVRVGPYIGERYEGLNGSASPENLETLFQLVYLYFTAPRKDTATFNAFLSRQRSIVENMYDNPYYYFAAAKNEIKYRGRPRRQMTTMEDLEAISLDRAFAIYRERFADASDFTFVLVGNFETKNIKPLIATYLGNLPTLRRDERWRDLKLRLADGPIDTAIIRGKAPKALVELTYHGDFDYYNADNRYLFYSMARLLRLRFRETLREELGGVYGVRVSARATGEPEESYRITISFNAEPKEVDTLTHTLMTVVEDIKNHGVDDKYVKKITAGQRQQRIRNLEENGFWQGQLTARYRQGLPLQTLLQKPYESLLSSLNASKLQKAVGEYMTPQNLIKILLFPEENSQP